MPHKKKSLLIEQAKLLKHNVKFDRLFPAFIFKKYGKQEEKAVWQTSTVIKIVSGLNQEKSVSSIVNTVTDSVTHSENEPQSYEAILQLLMIEFVMIY